MDMNDFSKANSQRCTAHNGFGHSPGEWSRCEWMIAVLGELGEAANVLKKLNRCRDGIPGNQQTKEELTLQLECEIADTFIYLDLLAQACGFLLSEAVQRTWNQKSEKIGYPRRI